MARKELAKEAMEENNLSSKKKEYNPNIYVFSSNKDGEIKDNIIYIGVYDLGAIPQLANLKKPKGSWVYRYGVHTHNVYDKNLRKYYQLICQNPAKNFFVEPKSKCPFCETANKIYRVRERFQGKKTYDEIKNDLTYKFISDKAKKFVSMLKYPYVVLDLEKVSGKKPMTELEQKEGLGLQCVFMPFNANEQIIKIVEKQSLNFWEFCDVNGKFEGETKEPIDHIWAINVTRNNTEGAKKAKYSAVFERNPVKIATDWFGIIEDSMNPFEHLFDNVTKDEYNQISELNGPTDEEIEDYAIVSSEKTADNAPKTGGAPAAPRRSPQSGVENKDSSSEPEGSNSSTPASPTPAEASTPTETGEPAKRRRRMVFDE